MKIIDLDPSDDDKIRQTAALLVAGFKDHWPSAWPNIESAYEEVQESLETERISRIAVDPPGTVLGWIGAIPEYDGYVWELHPLVVRQDRQGQGVGRGLVADLEELGFVVVGVVPDANGPGKPDILMAKRIGMANV